MKLRPLLARIFELRFFKFGLVGASGTIVNTVVLYLCQEYLLTFIDAPALRLNVSLALAILCATVNNFSWNRGWTWADRGALTSTRWLTQFGQYASACWVGIALQFLITKLLSAHIYYLFANLIAIGMASVFNYLLNDLWTFGGFKRWSRKPSSVPSVPSVPTVQSAPSAPSAQSVPTEHPH